MLGADTSWPGGWKEKKSRKKKSNGSPPGKKGKTEKGVESLNVHLRGEVAAPSSQENGEDGKRANR